MRIRKRRSPGVSILEICMSFSVITVVIIAFATVFPSGYRLNFANMNQNKASSLASSVIEELRGIKPHQETGAPPETLRTLAGANKGQTIYNQLSQDLRNQLAYGGATASTPYYIAGATGIRIDETIETISVGSAVATYVISVDVSWAETRRRTQIIKTITISGLVTDALKTTYTK